MLGRSQKHLAFSKCQPLLSGLEVPGHSLSWNPTARADFWVAINDRCPSALLDKRRVCWLLKLWEDMACSQASGQLHQPRLLFSGHLSSQLPSVLLSVHFPSGLLHNERNQRSSPTQAQTLSLLEELKFLCREL